MNKREWQRLFVRVFLYYLGLLLGIVGLLFFFPALEPYLPVGGLDRFSSTPSFQEVVSTYREVAGSEAVFRGVYRLVEAVLMSIAIGLTILIMIPVTWVFRATNRDQKKDRTVLETLMVLPVVITAIVLIIQNSIALAFGLAGIVAGVQYRNRLAFPVNAAYLFAAIAVGLASGIEAVGIGLIMAMWFCLTLITLRILGVSNDDRTDLAEPPDQERA